MQLPYILCNRLCFLPVALSSGSVAFARSLVAEELPLISLVDKGGYGEEILFIAPYRTCTEHLQGPFVDQKVVFDRKMGTSLTTYILCRDT